MQDGFDLDLLGNHQAQGLVAHSRRCARTVRDVYRVDAHRFQVTRALDFLRALGSLGGHDFDHDDKLTLGDAATEPRAFSQRRRIDRVLGRGRSLADGLNRVGSGLEARLHFLNVARSGAATATDQAYADIDEFLGVTRHVFRRRKEYGAAV